MDDNNFLYKPSSESDGRLVVLIPANLRGQVDSVSVNGVNGRFDHWDGRNGNRGHYRFDRPGSAFGQGVVTTIRLKNGEKIDVNIGDGGRRELGPLDTSGIDLPQTSSNLQSQDSSGSFDQGGFSPLNSSGSSSTFLTDRYGQQQSIPGAVNYDAREILATALADSRAQGEFNIDRFSENFEDAGGFANELLDTEATGLENFVERATPLIRDADKSTNSSILRNTNIFNFQNNAATQAATAANTQQRINLFDQNAPGVQDALESSLSRAEGDNVRIRERESESIVDPALREVAARSARLRGADVGNSAGFGTTSATTDSLIDTFDFERVLNLNQLERDNFRLGDNAIRASEAEIRAAANNSANLFNDVIAPGIIDFQPIQPNPVVTNIGGQISPVPTVDAGTRQQAVTGALTDLNTLPTSTVFNESSNLQDAELTFEQSILNAQSEGENALFDKTEQRFIDDRNFDLFQQQAKAAQESNDLKNNIALGFGAVSTIGRITEIANGFGFGGKAGGAAATTPSGLPPSVTSQTPAAKIGSFFSTVAPPVALAATAYFAYQGIDTALDGNLDDLSPLERFGAGTATLGFSEAINFVSNQFDSGKPKDQQARDGSRDVLQQGNIVDQNYQVTLADGSKFDVGKDGGDKIENIDGSSERGYQELDLDNPLHYVTAGPAEAVSVITTGNGIMRNHFVNAANSNSESTEQSFANLRAISNVDFQTGVNSLGALFTADAISNEEYNVLSQQWLELWSN